MSLSQRMAAKCLARWMITRDRQWLAEAVEWHSIRLERDEALEQQRIRLLRLLTKQAWCRLVNGISIPRVLEHGAQEVVTHQDDEHGVTARVTLDRACGVAHVVTTYDKPLVSIVFETKGPEAVMDPSI